MHLLIKPQNLQNQVLEMKNINNSTMIEIHRQNIIYSCLNYIHTKAKLQ